MADAVIVICSRPESRRIQEKCFRPIAGVPAMEHILRRTAKTGLPVILAVPDGKGSAYRQVRQGAYMVEGDPDSPLHRMADAVRTWGETHAIPKYIVRVTHDDILIDAETVLNLIDAVDENGAGYGIAPTIAEGMGVEVIHAANLFHAAEFNNQPIEHISYFVRGPGLPVPGVLEMLPREAIRRPYRLTMDYPEDVAVLQAVLSKLGPMADNDAICAYLDRNSYLLEYNRLPEVSVYTCARNAEKWIRDAMVSVPGNAEYVVVDDGSTDGTLAEVLYMRRPSQKIVINEKNVGLASSSNLALGECRGRYIMRLDADDKVFSWGLDLMLEEIKKTGAAIVYANYHEFNENDEIIRENVDARLHHHAGCALMDSRLINEIKFKDGLRHWDSLDLYQRVSKRFPIAYMEEPLWLYRVRGDSMSRTNLEEREKCKP